MIHRISARAGFQRRSSRCPLVGVRDEIVATHSASSVGKEWLLETCEMESASVEGSVGVGADDGVHRLGSEVIGA